MFPISDSMPSRRFPFINIAIIIVTAYVFYQQIVASSQEAFIRQYALIPTSVDINNPYTLLPFVTAIFLHGGFLHILSNMWFLWVFGDNVEGHIGWTAYFLLYFLAGITGNVAQYLLMPGSSIPMLGASGAVAGILGAYFTLFPHAKIKTLFPIFIFLTVINVPAYFMLGYWFFLQVFSGAATLPFGSETGGIAFFAHVGGFIAGVLFVRLFKRSEIYT